MEARLAAGCWEPPLHAATRMTGIGSLSLRGCDDSVTPDATARGFVAFEQVFVATVHSIDGFPGTYFKVEVIIVKRTARAFIGTLLCAAFGATAAGLVWAAPLGSGFQYQAVIADAGGPLNGMLDLRVTLYDAADQGSVVAGPVDFDDVVATDGHVVLTLDFGGVFDGSARFLAIELRDGASSGPYTVLAPRQKLRTTPYAAHAVAADTAVAADSVPAAGDADTLDGQHGVFYLDWDNLTGVPAGLDDGDDNTLGELACAAGEIPVWGAGGWECGAEVGVGYASITVVGPVGGPVANGAALLAAMDAIAEPASAEQAHLLLIEPGLYDLDGAMLEGKPWVDIAGAGRNQTVVTSSVCAWNSFNLDATIGMTLGPAELRDLTAINTCSEPGEYGRAVQLHVGSCTLRVTRVDAIAAVGPTVERAIGVYGRTSNLVLEDVNAQASGGIDYNVGLWTNDDNIEILDSVGTATGGSVAYGLFIIADPDVGFFSSSVRRGSFKASGATWSVGAMIATRTGSVDLERFEATGDPALWISGAEGDKHVRVSQFTGTGGVKIDQYSGTMTAIIDQSRVVATGPTIDVEAGITARIAATQLWGGPVTGAPTCAGVWDESWTFFTNTCP